MPSLVSIGIVTGTFGLGCLHVILAYGLMLNRLPNFWSALPRYFITLYNGTTLTSVIFMHGTEGPASTLEAIIIAVPLGIGALS